MPKDKVLGPAIGLILTACLGLAMHLTSLIGSWIGLAWWSMSRWTCPRPWRAFPWIFSEGLSASFSLVGLLLAALILVGALQMLKLRGYAWSMVATIVAMVPCLSPCCCVGLPVGIWALVVLSDRDVRAAFSS